MTRNDPRTAPPRRALRPVNGYVRQNLRSKLTMWGSFGVGLTEFHIVVRMFPGQ